VNEQLMTIARIMSLSFLALIARSISRESPNSLTSANFRLPKLRYTARERLEAVRIGFRQGCKECWAITPPRSKKPAVTGTHRAEDGRKSPFAPGDIVLLG